jgi:hypothetical protein
MKPELESFDAWMLLLSTVRYAFGRMSYITGAAADLVVKYEVYLTEAQLQQILEEIDEEIDRYRRMESTLPDEDTWFQNRDTIRAVLDRRVRERLSQEGNIPPGR